MSSRLEIVTHNLGTLTWYELRDASGYPVCVMSSKNKVQEKLRECLANWKHCERCDTLDYGLELHGKCNACRIARTRAWLDDMPVSFNPFRPGVRQSQVELKNNGTTQRTDKRLGTSPARGRVTIRDD